MTKVTPRRQIGAELRLMGQRARQVWGLVPRQHKFMLAAATALVMVTSAGNAGLALLLGGLVDTVKNGLEEQRGWSAMFWPLAGIFAAIGAIYVGRELLHVARRYMAEKSCAALNRDMQTRVVGHMLKTDLRWFAQEKVGTQHGRILRSVEALVRFVRIMFLDCLPAVFTGLFALLAAVTKMPILGLVMLGVVPVSLWLTIRQLISQRPVRLAIMRDCEHMDGVIIEQFGGAEYLRAAHTYDIEEQRLAQAAEQRRRRELHHHFSMSLYGCGKAINEHFFHVCVLALATYLAVRHQVTCGDILVFSVLYLNVMTPLNEVHRILDEGHDVTLRVGDLMEILDEPWDRSFAPRGGVDLRFEIGLPAIEVEQLVVDYPSPEGELVRGLDNISLRIDHGECIGVVGPSGSGKSTWVKTLLRLVHPDHGRIRLGGVPLEQIGREDLARHIGYVGQTPFVFSGTVSENIAYGKGPVDAAQIRHAAIMAYLHEEIERMPGDYDAQIAERGNNLSGGQRQRLAVARMLLQRTPILILDEATSALDNISERRVQNALDIAEANRTTLIIAHRLSTLRHCDRILVFDQGRIVEVGTYDELLRMNGLFTRLVNSAEHGVLEWSGEPGPTPDPSMALAPVELQVVAAPLAS